MLLRISILARYRHSARSLAFILLLAVSPAPGALEWLLTPNLHAHAEAVEELADWLGSRIGEPIEAESAASWREVAGHVRAGRFDIVFAPPHIVAWLVNEQGWHASGRVMEELRIVVVANRERQDIFELADLAGRTLCTPLAPDIANLVVFSRFSNRNRQPVSLEIPGGRAALQYLDDGRCDAVVMSEGIFNSAPSGVTRDFILLMKSESLGHYGFATRQHPDHPISDIAGLLAPVDGREASTGLLLEFSATVDIEAPAPGDYPAELADWLDDSWD